ncbi:hypothetical protein [Actinacidiphila soli]|uniref:hypothetical protein n=1 Tax=Actinacidiphila soli TaxID=2487275 RepID=UPI000FCA6F19|nr:hypothetical protein [Actinacidiphila soli]
MTWKNGKIVSVETWDANESNAKVFDPDTTAKAVSNKMDPQGKGQTQNVVYVAKSQAEAEAIRDRFVSNKNVRVIFPDNQFDTHRLQPLIRKVPGGTLTIIPGEQAGKTPRTPTLAEPETGGGGGRMGKIMGAFGVVGELFTIYGAMRDYQYWEKTGCDPTGLMGPPAAASRRPRSTGKPERSRQSAHGEGKRDRVPSPLRQGGGPRGHQRGHGPLRLQPRGRPRRPRVDG